MTVSESGFASVSHPVIAIDGPSGSGKSTVSREVARRLGLRYLDTGATYRALTWWLLQHEVDPLDEVAITALLQTGMGPRITVSTDPDHFAVRLNGENVEPAIRNAVVTEAVSPVSAVPVVRQMLTALQRRVINGGGIVAEGRDVGTVVAPTAQVKIFLTADEQARAQRRVAQGTVGGDVQHTLAAMKVRDARDSKRKVAPLAQAPDAHVVDTTAQSQSQVIDTVIGIVAQVMGSREGSRRDNGAQAQENDAREDHQRTIVLPPARTGQDTERDDQQRVIRLPHTESQQPV